MTCERKIQTQRLHDGELAPVERQVQEAHLRVCPDCRRLLSELRGVSRLLKDGVPEPLSDEQLAMLRERAPCEERAILRIAGWFTATAAGILLVTVLSWPSGRMDTADVPSIWENAALTMVDLDTPDSELLVVAQWMADDLASGNGALR